MAIDLYIGLGSNLGDRRAFLESGLRQLAQTSGCTYLLASSLYETAPVGPVKQPAFLNAAAHFSVDLSPQEILTRLMAIESAHGRQREIHWGPRTLDPDLLLYGDWLIDTPALQVPHPHLTQRAFVLDPLLEIAPALKHPQTGQPLTACHPPSEACQRLPQRQWHRPLT